MPSQNGRFQETTDGQAPAVSPTPSTAPAQNLLRFACITNTGKHRAHNEDNFLFFGRVMPKEHQSLDQALPFDLPQGKLAAVAVFDGMGGELAGEESSYVAAACLKQCLESYGFGYDIDSLNKAFTQMQQAVARSRDIQKLSSTGTTASVMLSNAATALIGNLGDSPIFLLRDGTLQTISESHTDEAMLKELGINRRPGLTQYLGMDDSLAPIEPHLVQLELEPGDWILLASDGLTDMVDHDTIAAALRDIHDPAEVVHELCQRALGAGGRDNITIIACHVSAR